MIVFVPVRTMSAREMEELRRSTTSVTRHDFVVPSENKDRESVFEQLGVELASALSVPLDAFVSSAPESLRIAARSGLVETLVEAKVFPTGGPSFAVQLVAQSRDRVSPTIAVFLLSFVGMAVGFFGSFLAGIDASIGGLFTCAVPFLFALPYVAWRKRAVATFSIEYHLLFNGVESTLSRGVR